MSFDDVKNLQQSSSASDTSSNDNYDSNTSSSSSFSTSAAVIGFKNLTTHAGATTLIYMLVKELKKLIGDGVYALEVNGKDFTYFNNRNMSSISEGQLKAKIGELSNAQVILIDLNDSEATSVCNEVIYLLEPSTVKLNSLIRKNPQVFEKIKNNKVVLNRSMLSNKDVTEFEYESNSKIFYNIPCLDDRADNHNLMDFLSRLGVIDSDGSGSGGILGNIFRR